MLQDVVTADTIGAVLAPLVATVTDGRAHPLAGQRVHFHVPVAQVLPVHIPMFLVADSGSERVVDADVTTDNMGRATVGIELGSFAGSTEVDVSLDSLRAVARYTIEPGHAVNITVQPADTSLYVDGTAVVHVAAKDRGGNPVLTPAIFTSTGAAVSVDSTGAVHGEDIGRTTVRAQVDSAAGEAAFSVVPRGRVAVSQADGDLSADTAVFVVELDGSSATPVYVGRALGILAELDPTWSPNGQELAFVSEFPLFALHVTTVPGTPEPVLSDDVLRGQRAPVYSPDASWIYFSASPTSFTYHQLWRLHPDGTGLDSLTASNGDDDLQDNWPSPSPDGTRIAFISNRTGIQRLFFLDLATGALTPAEIAARSVRWAPSGETLAYVTADGLELHVVQTDGSGERVLLAASSIEPAFSWSPDGAWIIARVPGHLSLVRVSDGLVLPLAPMRAFHEPSWMP
ncbi:MAG TPA: hypothetical protein VFK13_07565 [Gemmatimonadaceae bacterium]|nr:hypothetical protein [Gemmatimonadaceae bacterium]